MKYKEYEYELPKLIHKPKFIEVLNFDYDLTFDGLIDVNAWDYPLSTMSFHADAADGDFYRIKSNVENSDHPILDKSPHISYSKVKEYNSEGYTEYNYHEPRNYKNLVGFLYNDRYPYVPTLQYPLAGKLINKKVYKEYNDVNGVKSYLEILNEEYDYIIFDDIEKRIAGLVSTMLVIPGYASLSPSYFYELSPQVSKLNEKLTEQYFYDQNNQLTDTLTTRVNYYYDSDAHYMPTRIIRDKNGEHHLETQNFYATHPNYDGNFIADNLINENKIAIPLDQKLYEVNTMTSDSQLLSSQTIEFAPAGPVIGGFTLPKRIEQIKGNSNEVKELIIYDSYDDYGNVLEIKNTSLSITTSYIYGYDNEYPIAEITNATLTEIAQVLNMSEDDVIALDENDMNTLNSLRDLMPNAQLSTYTYNPLVGISTITDPRGQTTYYIYDDFNRLKHIEDEDGNIIEEYEYNYKD